MEAKKEEVGEAAGAEAAEPGEGPPASSGEGIFPLPNPPRVVVERGRVVTRMVPPIPPLPVEVGVGAPCTPPCSLYDRAVGGGSFMEDAE